MEIDIIVPEGTDTSSLTEDDVVGQEIYYSANQNRVIGEVTGINAGDGGEPGFRIDVYDSVIEQMFEQGLIVLGSVWEDLTLSYVYAVPDHPGTRSGETISTERFK